MADQKVTALSAITDPINTDVVYIVDDAVGTPVSKKVTCANLITKAHGLSDGMAVIVSNVLTSDTTPDIGTPSAGVLTNCTGLPISTGVSGLAANVATFLATPSSANLATAVTDETGSGALVFGTSPSLTTPDIGTPSAGTLTSCTGLPISTGVSGLAANVATFLATPSSANLIAAVTDETGTGALVFATSPTLVTPALGTPSSGNLSNCTAYEGTAVLSTGEAGGTKFLREDGDGTCSWQAVAGGGNTLDQAYDQGGAGSGRTIDADSGAVEITVSDTDNNVAFIVNANDVTNNQNGINVVVADTNTGDGVFIDHNDTGNSRALCVDSEATSTNTGVVDIGVAVNTGIGLNITANSLTSGSAQRIVSSSDAMGGGIVMLIDHDANAITANATGEIVRINAERQLTAAATRSDNYDGMLIYRENKVNNGGGTLNTTGAVLQLFNNAVTTAGTLNDTVVPLKMTNTAVTSTNFTRFIQMGALTIWISDGTTAEGALTGVEGDICLNGGTGAGQTAYCDAAGTNWTDM